MPEEAGQRTPSIVEGMIRESSIGILRAPPRSGASWLSLDLAAAVAGSGVWLGRETSDPAHAGVSYIHTTSTDFVRERLARLRELRHPEPGHYSEAIEFASISEDSWGSLLEDPESFPVSTLYVVDCPTLSLVRSEPGIAPVSLFKRARDRSIGYSCGTWLFVVPPEWSLTKFRKEHHALDLDFELELKPEKGSSLNYSLSVYSRWFPSIDPIALRWNAPTFELASEAGQEEPLGVAEFVERFYGDELEPERDVVERAMEANVSNRRALKLVKQARDEELVRSERPNPREPYMVAKLAAVAAE